MLISTILPFIFLASLQPDFLKTYPRLKLKYFNDNYFGWFSLFEPFYLINFFTLEWFFRGFLIIGMTKVLGHRSILPMAVLYCSFHFGKPMGECISSFFGGYILGVVAYYSKSIWGGVLVHIGIALSMDIFAILSHFFWLKQ